MEDEIKAEVLVEGYAGANAPAASVEQRASLIEFPCFFPIKVLGPSIHDFLDDIVSTVHELDETFNTASVEQRVSRAGRYTSLTCTVYAKNKAHLDNIYRALTSHPKVVYVL